MQGQPQADRLNKLLTAWTADIGFVLDRLERLNTSDPSGKFTGRLDMTRVGVFGHSFGGAQAAQFCSRIPGARRASMWTVVRLAASFRLASNSPSCSSSATITLPTQRAVKSRPTSNRFMIVCRPDGRLRIVIRGANHFTFSDDGALLKSHVMRGVLRMFGMLGIDGRRQLEVTAYCVHSFFDAYLKGPGVSRLEISSPLYPEIQIIE